MFVRRLDDTKSCRVHDFLPPISMLLTVIDGGLESLKRCFMNPLQPFALILWNACTSHQTLELCSLATEGTQEPPCGKLCLSIATVSS